MKLRFDPTGTEMKTVDVHSTRCSRGHDAVIATYDDGTSEVSS